MIVFDIDLHLLININKYINTTKLNIINNTFIDVVIIIFLSFSKEMFVVFLQLLLTLGCDYYFSSR